MLSAVILKASGTRKEDMRKVNFDGGQAFEGAVVERLLGQRNQIATTHVIFY